MKRYDSYKPTKIELLDVIPTHWEEKRMRFLGFLYGGLSGKSATDFNQPSNKNNKNFIPFTNVANNLKIDPDNLHTVVIKENENQNRVQKGDLFFLMSSENYDDVGRSAVLVNDLKETYLNSFCKGFRITKENIIPEFLNYQLHSKQLRHNLLTGANGFTRINLKIDKVIDLFTALPPFPEQTAIANYLDRKTAEIDELITDKKRLLELYEEEKTAIINQAVTKGLDPNAPMKDSGIEWLGEIPEHWEVKRLKYIAKSTPSNVDKKIKTDEKYIRLCNYVDVYYNDFITENILFMTASATENQISNFSLKGGDVIITKDSESPDDIAIPAYVLKDLNDVICGYHLNLIRPQKILGRYLFRFFQSQYSKIYYFVSANGVTRYGVGVEKISCFFVCNPPIEEQQSIVNYIETECARINVKKAIAEKLIELLTEYRTALISEVVTGKIKVTD